MPPLLPSSPLPGIHTLELTTAEAPRLQRFFEANPALFLATTGDVAQPTDAVDEITSPVPAGWHHTKKWVIGYADERGELAAMANVITDLLADTVFHIGTFIVATDRHGNGDAQALYGGLEDWSRDNGADWMRLGVVVGNTRAERFWASQGYVPVRRREGIEMGRRVVSVQTMVKPLTQAPMAHYLAMVARDRADGA